MENLIGKIKNLFLNRNTVTILGVIAGVIVLWFAYTATLNKTVKPITVPVANKNLTSASLITKDDIKYVEVNSDVLSKGAVIRSANQLINYYVKNGTSIAAGAMFYKEQVIERKDLIRRDTEIIPKGYTIYSLKVTNDTTYANSIYPGDKIDLWIRTRIDGNLTVYEEFITGIEVLTVRDNNKQNVFDVPNGRTPATLRFAVPNDIYEYLMNIELLKDMELHPVPRNTMYYDKDTKLEIVNTQLKDLIDSKVYHINYNNPSSELTENESNENQEENKTE